MNGNSGFRGEEVARAHGFGAQFDPSLFHPLLDAGA